MGRKKLLSSRRASAAGFKWKGLSSSALANPGRGGGAWAGRAHPPASGWAGLVVLCADRQHAALTMRRHSGLRGYLITASGGSELGNGLGEVEPPLS